MRVGLLVSPLLALAGTSAVAAAPALPEPSNGSAIVVEGIRDRDKQIEDFVHQMTPAPVGGQLARFEQPICPAVTGLPDRQDLYVADRMRRVAEAAGIPVGKPKCDPNVVVMVTPNKAKLLGQLARHRWDYLPLEWSGSQIRALERDPSPVAAWQFEALVRADGTLVPQDSLAGALGGPPVAAYVNRTMEPASRLRTLGRRAFVGAVVVVQGDALVGLTTTQLADYALMRALVRSDPKQMSGTRSILSIIDTPVGAPVPVTLTPWDLSFLKAFYQSGKTTYANYQRSEISELMKRNFDGRTGGQE